MKIHTILFAASVILGLSASISIQAQTPFSISYDFTGSPIQDPTTSTGNIEGNSMAWTGFTSTSASFSSGSDTAYVRSDTTSYEFNLGEYIEFTVTATNGEVLNMDSITFNFGGSSNATGTGKSGNVYSVLRVGAPTDDFSTLSDLTLTPDSTTVATTFVPENDTAYNTFTADLSDSAYQNISSLTFRLYVYAETHTGNVYLRYSDISASGTTAIPETNTTALLSGIAVLLVVCLRRRIRR